jgi:putative flavoprotein involved in K+ transport
LAASSRLADVGCEHVVLERGRIGWSWRTQRWDSFRLNTPLWANRVPGKFLTGAPESFASASSLVQGLEQLAARLPVYEGVEVLRADRVGPAWRLETSSGTLLTGSVVVASGFQNVSRMPEYGAALPAQIEQLHAAQYRRPDDLEGPVLVVGGGQSGVQIAEDLLEAGQRVYLSTSRVARLPRRYRGRDGLEWLRDLGQLDVSSHQADLAVMAAAPPQVSGVAGGRTVSYQHLARQGATLLGRVIGSGGRRLELAQDLGANVRFADEASADFRAAWDRLAARRGDELDAGHLDPADEPGDDLYGSRGPAFFDLVATGVSTVIWATGFEASTGWLPQGALDDYGRPQLPGLSAIGAPWLTHRSSANLYGMAADAERVADLFAGADVGAAA